MAAIHVALIVYSDDVSTTFLAVRAALELQAKVIVVRNKADILDLPVCGICKCVKGVRGSLNCWDCCFQNDREELNSELV